MDIGVPLLNFFVKFIAHTVYAFRHIWKSALNPVSDKAKKRNMVGQQENTDGQKDKSLQNGQKTADNSEHNKKPASSQSEQGFSMLVPYEPFHLGLFIPD